MSKAKPIEAVIKFIAVAGLLLGVGAFVWVLSGGCAPPPPPPPPRKPIELPSTEDVGKSVGSQTRRFGSGFVDGWREAGKKKDDKKQEGKTEDKK